MSVTAFGVTVSTFVPDNVTVAEAVPPGPVADTVTVGDAGIAAGAT